MKLIKSIETKQYKISLFEKGNKFKIETEQFGVKNSITFNDLGLARVTFDDTLKEMEQSIN